MQERLFGVWGRSLGQPWELVLGQAVGSGAGEGAGGGGLGGAGPCYRVQDSILGCRAHIWGLAPPVGSLGPGSGVRMGRGVGWGKERAAAAATARGALGRTGGSLWGAMPGGYPGPAALCPPRGWDHGQGKDGRLQGVGDPGTGPLPAPGQPQGTENLRLLEPSLPQDTWSAIAPEGPAGSERRQERDGSGFGVPLALSPPGLRQSPRGISGLTSPGSCSAVPAVPIPGVTFGDVRIAAGTAELREVQPRQMGWEGFARPRELRAAFVASLPGTSLPGSRPLAWQRSVRAPAR